MSALTHRRIGVGARALRTPRAARALPADVVVVGALVADKVIAAAGAVVIAAFVVRVAIARARGV